MTVDEALVADVVQQIREQELPPATIEETDVTKDVSEKELARASSITLPTRNVSF